jgi:cation diffusion facilitator family transporter
LGSNTNFWNTVAAVVVGPPVGAVVTEVVPAPAAALVVAVAAREVVLEIDAEFELPQAASTATADAATKGRHDMRIDETSTGGDSTLPWRFTTATAGRGGGARVCQPGPVHEGSRRAILAAFVANLGIAIAKLAGFLITGSAGLMAEALHSLADTGNQGLLMLGSKRAKLGESSAHPFGHGRERYFWAFVVALVLFSLGGMFALFEGYDKLRHPHATDNAVVGYVILGVAVVLESFSLRTAVREARSHRPPDTSWWRFIRRAKEPELPVVLLEDTGALLGLLFAFVGLMLSQITDNARWDAVGSMAIGVLLVSIAVVLVVEMKSLLIGEAASPEMQRAIIDAIKGAPNVTRLIHMRTEHLAPDEVLLAAKVEFDDSLSGRELTAAIDEVEAHVRAAAPAVTLIYLEPDVLDPARL